MIVSFLRTFLLYIIVIVAMRIMGKKQVGELEPVELVIVLLLSELASIPMQDMNLPLMHSIVPIASLLALEILISAVNMKIRKSRDIFQGKPTILINKGILDIKELKNNRYNIDEVMEEIRAAGYADIRDVEYAVLENSGKISIIPSSRNKPTTVSDFNIKAQPGAFPYLVISDGEIIEEVLSQVGITAQQLDSYLLKSNITDIKTVFYAVLDSNNEFYYQLR